MLRLIMQSAKISPPQSPPPRPSVSVYFRGKSQDPQEATCPVQTRPIGALLCKRCHVTKRRDRHHPGLSNLSSLLLRFLLVWLLCLHFFQWMATCPTLCNPINCRLPSSSVHGILQARILEWVTMPSHTYLFLGKNLRFTNLGVLCRAMDCSLLKMFLEKTDCSG